MLFRALLCLWVLCLSFAGQAGGQPHMPDPAREDRRALLDIAAALTTRPANWREDVPLEKWDQVGVNDEGRVDWLALRKVSGRLSPAVGRLTALESLSIEDADFTSLPEELGDLHDLRTLRLADTPLTALPQRLARLAALEELHIVNMPLDKMPGALDVLSQWLRVLHPRDLTLIGCGLQAFPPEVRHMRGLSVLDVSRNAITGPLPPWLFTPALSWLLVDDNALTGALPEAICASPRLEYLAIQRNAFRGALPPCMAQLPLQVFFYEGNALTMDEAMAARVREIRENLHRALRDG